MTNCYCGSAQTYQDCCQKYITNQAIAPTAQALMRSRYSAYCVQAVEYLVQTTHPSTRKYHHPQDILEWSKTNHWVKLEIIHAAQNTVEFKAYYLDQQLTPITHHEKSTFKQLDNRWYYVDGIFY